MGDRSLWGWARTDNFVLQQLYRAYGFGGGFDVTRTWSQVAAEIDANRPLRWVVISLLVDILSRLLAMNHAGLWSMIPMVMRGLVMPKRRGDRWFIPMTICARCVAGMAMCGRISLCRNKLRYLRSMLNSIANQLINNSDRDCAGSIIV
jgi:hypothetical protein